MEQMGNGPQPSEFDSGVYTTAEMVYRVKSSRGDYHDNMDTDTFLMWLDRRMVPAFRAKHGADKTLVLILDNAPYHHGRHRDGFFCNEHNKEEIAAKLKELKCRRLNVRLTPTRKRAVHTPQERPTSVSPPEEFIGWYLLDVEDNETFEVTHMATDDEYGQGTVVCVTKMGVQRGLKSWYAIDRAKAVEHGLRTFGQLLEDPADP